MNSVFGVLHHLRMLSSQMKSRQIGDIFFCFYCWQHILPISRVTGVINEFGFRCFTSFMDALAAR